MIKHWLITGDTHGQVLDRLNNIDTTKYPLEETALIILGDAGLNFYLNKTDKKNKHIVNNRGFMVYCVRGNHEERPENLNPIEFAYDMKIQGWVWREPEYPNIAYLDDGGLYEIAGHTVLVIGGAYSVDKYYRLSRFPADATWTGWFEDEQLLDWEMQDIATNIKGKEVDFVLTHTCPVAWEPTDLFLSGIDQSKVDKTMELWFQELKDTFSWKVWLFGHYHDDRLVRPGVEMYFRDMEEIDTIWERWQHPDNLDWWLKKDPLYYSGV